MTTVLNKIATLEASEYNTRGSTDRLSETVAADGDLIMVGGTGNNVKVHVFKTSDGGTTWSEISKFRPTNVTTGPNQNWGLTVALDGDLAIVGSPGDESIEGSVTFFKTTDGGTTWVQKTQIKHNDVKVPGTSQGYLGSRVKIYGNFAIASAPVGKDEVGQNPNIGTAHVFRTTDGGESWSHVQLLKPKDGDSIGAANITTTSTQFSNHGAFAINDKYIVIGASGEKALYFYKTTDGGASWTLKQKMTSNTVGFGKILAIAGDIVVNGEVQQSRAVVYSTSDNGESWTRKQDTLRYGATGTIEGRSVDISKDGTTIVSGGNFGGETTNKVVVFRTTDNWNSFTKPFLLEMPTDSQWHAGAVAISGNTVVSGSAVYGKPYVFKLSGGGSSVAAEEQALIDLSVQTADIDVLRAVAFSNKSNGKGDADATSRAKVKALMAAASSDADKRKKRRAALKFLFSLDTDVTKMVIPKDDLDLPAGFKKANALVLKAGQTMAVSDLAAGEGFYSVLDNEETVTITTDNTSLTFTRGDVGDNELYTVSATTWTDVTINTDEVSGGNFAENNNTGTLAPGDIVAIDGRKFIIGSVADGGSAASGGDPYVFPMKSNCPVKLPNKPAVYRMFEQGDNYVNVEVAEATEEHKRRMIDYASKLTPVTHNVVTDGYFYSKAFISAEGHQLTVDYASREVNTDESSMDFFTIKQGKNTFDCGDFKEEAKCWTVGWTTSEGKRIEAKLLFFRNPHLENGVSVVPSTLKNSTGLIVDNYKPKLMELPSLTTEKFSKLHRRLAKTKNMRQKMNIKGKNEKWVFN